MPGCKNCKSEKVVRNGIVRGKQRYRCKECGYNFVEGDGRANEKIAAKKAMCDPLLLGKGIVQCACSCFQHMALPCLSVDKRSGGQTSRWGGVR